MRDRAFGIIDNQTSENDRGVDGVVVSLVPGPPEKALIIPKSLRAVGIERIASGPLCFLLGVEGKRVP